MDTYVTQYDLEFKRYDYYVHYESKKGCNGDGVFVASVPTVGSRAEGPTIKGAIANVTEMTRRDLIELADAGAKLPDSDPNSKHQVFINVKIARKVKI